MCRNGTLKEIVGMPGNVTVLASSDASNCISIDKCVVLNTLVRSLLDAKNDTLTGIV